MQAGRKAGLLYLGDNVDPTLRTAANYVSYYLTMGLDPSEIEQRFTDKFGQLAGLDFQQALDAAERGIQNTKYFNLEHGNKKLKNALDLTGNDTGEIQVRYLVQVSRVEVGEHGQLVTASRYFTIQRTVSTELRIADVRNMMAGSCREFMQQYDWDECEFNIIPGLLLTGED